MVDDTRILTNQTIAYKIALTQLVVTLFIAITLWLIFDSKTAYSALLGGLICAAGTFLLAKIMFGLREMTPKQMVLAFYVGEASKLVLTIAGFIAAFLLVDLNVAAFILTYITTLTLHWFAFLIPNK